MASLANKRENAPQSPSNFRTNTPFFSWKSCHLARKHAKPSPAGMARGLPRQVLGTETWHKRADWRPRHVGRGRLAVFCVRVWQDVLSALGTEQTAPPLCSPRSRAIPQPYASGTTPLHQRRRQRQATQWDRPSSRAACAYQIGNDGHWCFANPRGLATCQAGGRHVSTPHL